MNSYRVNGYVVVSGRRESGYRGIDRRPWEAIETALHDDDLPARVRDVFSRCRRERIGLWWPVATCVADAKTLLDFARRKDESAEIVAVYSSYLAAHGQSGWPSDGLIPLGIDIVSAGEWSLLGAIAEAKLDVPSWLRASTNENWLLSDPALLVRVERLYRVLSIASRVEPIAAQASGVPVEGVSVFRVQTIRSTGQIA